jgi:uncharacterized protein YmfQ (DUF2313 family)
MKTNEQYSDAIHKLAPSGFIMPAPQDDTNLSTLFSAFADALLAVDNEANDILSDTFPDSAGSFLTDWERVLGLPREGISGQTAQERRDVVLAWLNISPYSTKQFFIDIAAVMGFTITVEDKEDDAGLGDFEWRVITSSDLPVSYFRTGQSRCGEPLVNAGANEPLEALIEFFAPAHTTPSFQYVSNLIAEDSDNLVAENGDNLIG